MAIEYVNTLSAEDFNRLRAAVGWMPVTLRRAAIGLANTAFIVAAVDGDQTVGMARVLTDGGYVVYIADVVVLPEYQGRGIGDGLMQRVMAYIRENLVDEDDQFVLTFLVAAEGKEAFYNRYGLTARPLPSMGLNIALPENRGGTEASGDLNQ